MQPSGTPSAGYMKRHETLLLQDLGHLSMFVAKFARIWLR